jgi:HSP20 family molecular chaperone IbpA
MPLYPRRKPSLSARWRRSKKNLRKFDILKALKKAENKKASRIFRVKSSRIKGNTRPLSSTVPKIYRKRELKEPEPLIDIIGEEKEVIVVAEFVGFKREDLKIHVKNQHLTLSAETVDKKYHKSLNLPAYVIPNSMRTTSKNGVLEIRLKKVTKEKAVDNVAGLENAA